MIICNITKYNHKKIIKSIKIKNIKKENDHINYEFHIDLFKKFCVPSFLIDNPFILC